VKLALVALLCFGCAAGVATSRPDGSCEVRGVALGRAEIASYRGRTDVDDPKAQMKCAALHGGTGSSDFYDAISAAVGAVVGWLAAP